jgi:hypothetical protein
MLVMALALDWTCGDGSDRGPELKSALAGRKREKKSD